MRFRPAAPQDRATIEALLAARPETALFPLSNLLEHGMTGGHPRAMRFWLGGEPPVAVLGRSEEGMAFPQLGTPLEATLAAAAGVLAAAPLRGLIGEATEVAALRVLLGIEARSAEIDTNEALLTLDLARLDHPVPADLSLLPFAQAPRDLLVAWRAAYGREVMGWGADAEGRAARDVAAQAEAGRHRVLLRSGVPVAQAGINAAWGEPGRDIVQVGAVWTPPAMRGQGLARAAVALLLHEARGAGARRAVLFTASAAAERAYRALGFEDAGRFALLVLHEPRAATAMWEAADA